MSAGQGYTVLTSLKSVGYLYKVTKKVTELFNMQSKLILLSLNTYISALPPAEESHHFVKNPKYTTKNKEIING
jgi:hypothetical protein